MRAIHIPTGTPFEASEVDPDGPLKAGPWRCSIPGCDATFKSHRRASHRRAPAGGEPILVNATFVNHSDDDHSPECRNGFVKQQDDDVRETITRRDVIHLDLTFKVAAHTGSNERAANPPRYPRNEYKARANTARQLRRLHDQVLEDDDTMSTSIVADGTIYRWWELAFGPAQASLARLKPTIAGTFNLKNRPWFVRGVVAGPLRRTGRLKPYIILRGTDEPGLPPTDNRVIVVAELSSPAAETVAGLEEGDVIAVLSIDGRIATNYRNPWIEIAEQGQIEVVSKHGTDR